jgi:hypothetical protein
MPSHKKLGFLDPESKRNYFDKKYLKEFNNLTNSNKEYLPFKTNRPLGLISKINTSPKGNK